MGCQRTEPPSDTRLPLLRNGAEALHVDLDRTALERFDLLYALLADHGRRYNLTSVLDYAQVQTRHFLESLALGAALRREAMLTGTERLADIGAGAGFPCLPLKIAWPGLHITAIEATRKKAEFIELAASELGLHGFCVVNARAEDAAHRAGLREGFDIVTARAVAPLPALAELLLPFARIGGLAAALKGSRLDEEQLAARGSIARCGGGGQREVVLGDDRVPIAARLLLIRKRSNSPGWLPRSPGTPRKAPLS